MQREAVIYDSYQHLRIFILRTYFHLQNFIAAHTFNSIQVHFYPFTSHLDNAVQKMGRSTINEILLLEHISWPRTQLIAKFVWLPYRCRKQVTEFTEFLVCTSYHNTSWCVQTKRNLTLQLTRMHLMSTFRIVTNVNILILANEVSVSGISEVFQS